MSRTFVQRIHQQRLQADLSQIARVGKGEPSAIEAVTIGVLGQAFVQPNPTAFVSPVAAESFASVAVIAPVTLPPVGIPSVEIEFLVDVSASAAAASSTPSVNDVAVDVIAPESPTITVAAIIVSVV